MSLSNYRSLWILENWFYTPIFWVLLDKSNHHSKTNLIYNQNRGDKTLKPETLATCIHLTTFDLQKSHVLVNKMLEIYKKILIYRNFLVRFMHFLLGIRFWLLRTQKKNIFFFMSNLLINSFFLIFRQ